MSPSATVQGNVTNLTLGGAVSAAGDVNVVGTGSFTRTDGSTGVLADPSLPARLDLPVAGEAATLRRWAEFRESALAGYADHRDRPDLPGTSRLSVHLKYGTVHPRTLLADLAGRSGQGAETFRKELAWREFYADVLWHEPRSARECLNTTFARLRLDSDQDRCGR